MNLVIMFCNIPEIEIHEIPEGIDYIEDYIYHTLGYNTDEVSWQCYSKEQGIKIKFKKDV